MFMMPNTRVSPADIKKRVTPNCTPFMSCSTKSATVMAQRAPRRCVPRDLLRRHFAFTDIRVGMVFVDQSFDRSDDLAFCVLFHLRQVKVLNGKVIAVEFETPANRFKFCRFHCSTERLDRK